MYRSIMVPLDGSSFGEQALPLALSLARRAKARVELIHVYRPIASVYAEPPLMVDPTLESQLIENQRAYLADVVRRVGSASTVPVTPVFLEGEVVPRLQAHAANTGADLVVMTTHGRGAMGRFWLGSVADELVRQLPMPLLLVRPHEGAVDLQHEPYLKKVLLPLDGSALAEQMLEPAIALGELLGAEFTLLRVIKPVMPISYEWEGANMARPAQSMLDELQKIHEQLRQEAQAYLDQVAERLRAGSLHVQTRVVVEDQPALAILKEAENLVGGMIALETHGRRGLSRLFLGSVADKVLRGTGLPVLVHRPAKV